MSFVRHGIAASLIILAVPAFGHEGPEQLIATLTAAIARRGTLPELLYQRACEYRVLGNLQLAEVDLAAAVKADPTHFSAGLELARIQVALRRHAEASITIGAVQPFAESATEEAACRMIRCDIAQSKGNLVAALEECDAACQLLPNQIEWILLRSRIQAELDEHEARVLDLKSSMTRNPNGAVAIELVEAKIDAGDYAEVLAEIESELANVRLRASWLLRRARVLLELGRSGEAHADLRAAIDELDLRLDTARPDAVLLTERGLALALLGETAAAQADLAAARSYGVEDWTARRLEASLAKR